MYGSIGGLGPVPALPVPVLCLLRTANAPRVVETRYVTARTAVTVHAEAAKAIGTPLHHCPPSSGEAMVMFGMIIDSSQPYVGEFRR